MKKNNNYAPIVLFIYNRPEHTLKTLEALSRNILADKSDLFIYADGPKENATKEQLLKIQKTRDAAKSQQWCKNVTIIKSEKNKGLAASIISGVSEIVNKYGSIIVLEDDLITSPYFLQYMNDALYIYKDNNKVACINGYVEPHKKQLPETFFLKGADCWGWATWKRAWDFFNPNGKDLLEELHAKKCEKHFNFDNTFPYVQMLEEQIAGKINSWAIRWLASAYLNEMYCLYPNQSLVVNDGFDGSGSHCGKIEYIQTELTDSKVNVIYQEPKECVIAWKAYKRIYIKRRDSEKTRNEKIVFYIKSILRPFYHLIKKIYNQY